MEATISLRTHGDIWNDGAPRPVQVQMEWYVEDPAVLNFEFTDSEGQSVLWGFDRAMIRQSLATDGPYFFMVLAPIPCPTPTYVRIPREDVECAVAMSQGEIEIGSDLESEILQANVEDALNRLLG